MPTVLQENKATGRCGCGSPGREWHEGSGSMGEFCSREHCGAQGNPFTNLELASVAWDPPPSSKKGWLTLRQPWKKGPRRHAELSNAICTSMLRANEPWTRTMAWPVWLSQPSRQLQSRITHRLGGRLGWRDLRASLQIIFTGHTFIFRLPRVTVWSPPWRFSKAAWTHPWAPYLGCLCWSRSWTR